MKSISLNNYASLESTTSLSKQEMDMFVMKGITLTAKTTITPTTLAETPIHVKKTEEKICCLQIIVPTPGQVITLKGEFKRMDSGHSLPIKDSFCISFSTTDSSIKKETPPPKEKAHRYMPRLLKKIILQIRELTSPHLWKK